MRAAIKQIKREIDEIEYRIAEKERQRENLALIIVFDSYDDGTVPNVIDRPITEWELYKEAQKNFSGCIVLSPVHEYCLRKGYSKCYNNVCIAKNMEYFEPDKMPEATQEERIPREVFDSWLNKQMGKTESDEKRRI